MTTDGQLANFIGGGWTPAGGADELPVRNPATGDTLARVPLSRDEEVDTAAQRAAAAFHGWRRTPVTERVQPLFRLKTLLEEEHEDIARTLTMECGKTLAESIGEMRRGIENVEVACGMPSLMQGYNSEDVAAGIDETMIRQPLGPVAAITPFNFPGMIPLWFLPYAIACGNPFILKPSEKVPLTAQKIFSLVERIGLPPGVAQMVHGSRETVEAILDHPEIRAVSFVGSSAAAEAVYRRAAARGKRVQCQGGAKNPVVILPDANLDATLEAVLDSAFGCAGQRCLAASVGITVGAAHEPFTEALVDAARSRRLGFGLDEGVQMGPVISPDARERIETMIGVGAGEGARLLVDGRDTRVDSRENGFFVGPTVLDGVEPGSEIASSEVFGPVLGLHHVPDLDAAIELANSRAYGNMACLFTTSGGAARRFRYEVDAGNIGINIGVAAAMAFFPFCGNKASFFGDLHAQGRDAVEFYTEKKVVVERWV